MGLGVVQQPLQSLMISDELKLSSSEVGAKIFGRPDRGEALLFGRAVVLLCLVESAAGVCDNLLTALRIALREIGAETELACIRV